jgi:hypothetical protein
LSRAFARSGCGPPTDLGVHDGRWEEVGTAFGTMPPPGVAHLDAIALVTSARASHPSGEVATADDASGAASALAVPERVGFVSKRPLQLGSWHLAKHAQSSKSPTPQVHWPHGFLLREGRSIRTAVRDMTPPRPRVSSRVESYQVHAARQAARARRIDKTCRAKRKRQPDWLISTSHCSKSTSRRSGSKVRELSLGRAPPTPLWS